MDFGFKPLTAWPADVPRTPARQRRADPGWAGYADTLRRLKDEIRHLKALSVVVEAHTDRQNIRLDGHLRGSAVISDPGIIVHIELPGGQWLRYASDHYRDWQTNLHAVVLTLERLRLVSQYGCVKGNEQYRGFAALPPGGQTTASAQVLTRDGALAELARVAGVPVPTQYTPDLYRAAVRKAHPDAGGDQATFERVNEARKVLEAA
jgi:hypothetical protein